MGSNMEGGQFVRLGAFRASGSYRCLHQALGAYWLTALTTPQVCFNIGVGSTFHFTAVNLPSVFLVAVLFAVSRLFYPECHGQRAGD